MTDLEFHERCLRLHKGIVHALEQYAGQPGHVTFLPIAASLRQGADRWDAWVREEKAKRGPVLPPRSIP